MTFQELDLIEPLLRALNEEGYNTPTPIQSQSIPHSLKGRDLLACAQTGTGKTAAFALPILQLLHGEHLSRLTERPIKALILTPTRELAIQIEESFKAYGRHVRLRKLVIFGGVGQNPQVEVLKRGVDILVATPGRLLDLMGQGYIDLKDIEIFVLDEADRMLDMGFIHDVRRVIKQLPTKRQTLFFSATMPPEIAKLADDILTDPVKVAVTPISSTAEAIRQTVYFVDKKQKKQLLLHLLQHGNIGNALVFTRTKHGANRVAQDLSKAGIGAMAIHGNKSQTARQLALQKFKNGEIRVLVATDIAARGIDIEDLSHVVNFELPNIPESYVHRIGRTGRAGAEGTAFSFCDDEEKAYLKDIQKLIGKKVPVVEDHPFPLGESAGTEPPAPQSQQRQQSRNRQPRREQNRPAPRRDQPSRPARTEERASSETAIATPEPRQEGERRSSSSRRRQRGRDRRQEQPATQSGRQGQIQPQRNGQQAKPKPKSEQPTKQPAQEKTAWTDENDKKWSSSIFTETSPGKKGFIIKSDRDDSSKKRTPPRHGRRGKR